MNPPKWLNWQQWLTWLKAGLRLGRVPATRPVHEHQRALDLIKAVDAGGLPLNPAVVNDIARKLGLEVSTKARVEDTIARIRAALRR